MKSMLRPNCTEKNWQDTLCKRKLLQFIFGCILITFGLFLKRKQKEYIIDSGRMGLNRANSELTGDGNENCYFDDIRQQEFW